MGEEEEVHICAPKQGTILADDEDVEEEERPNEWLEHAELKHKEVVLKETKCLCVNTGFIGQEDEKPTKVVGVSKVT